MTKMENIQIKAQERSPEVNFDFANHKLSLKGESYPEDVASFYGPILKDLEKYLNSLDGKGHTEVDIQLVYFNSSSAKALMNFILMLDKAAKVGNKITINWHCHEDDDTMREFGEDFAEDVEAASFNLKLQEAA